MLKALELIGFKSFADKTRFEFPSGITVVVGPNGSGKSNVVDAIKWVLGEQSVKSLRGKEMADVIFNGSGTRKPINAAEATLTFDNSAGLLAIETPEVHITRRVYRSGEGEYLINREACRLRDIRDLFAGTGAATEAYSVIEQGKVDVLLQSSPKDRRLIFEEAAGSSRFKAKKLEASRRLERVDQNLLRLSDIVEEVESRLRSVRLQATKARRYKEYSDRLQELRTQVGLTDWRHLSTQIETLDAELTSLRMDADETRHAIESDESQTHTLENDLAGSDETLRLCESRIAKNRERIAAHESTMEHERARSRDLEEEVSRHRRHLSAMSTRAGNLDEQLRTTTSSLSAAEQEHAALQGQMSEAEKALQAATEELEALRKQSEAQRAEQMDGMRTTASLSSRASALESEITSLSRSAATRTQQWEQATKQLETLNEQVSDFQIRQTKLEQESIAASGVLEAARTQLASTRKELVQQQKEWTQLSGRRSGAVERANVLEELEKRLEGLSSGVKDVLVKARDAVEGPFQEVRGLVADLLQVSVETAPLVEIALGPLAQHVVVGPGTQLLEHIQANEIRWPGRVGFLLMEVQPPASAVDRVNLEGQPGVLGRADSFVEAAPEFLPLVRRLLGRTWFVETLSQALTLASGVGRGLNFVTLAGEQITAEGTMALGPRHSAMGLISRRSELRALRSTINEMETRLEELNDNVARLEARLAYEDAEVQGAALTFQQASDAFSDQRSKTAAAVQRHDEVQSQTMMLAAEIRSAEAQHEKAAAELATTRERLAHLESGLAELEAELLSAASRLDELETARSQTSAAATSRQVELATSEQRVDSLRHQHEQLLRDQQERTKALSDSRHQLSQASERLLAATQSILRSGSEIAELYLLKELLYKEAMGHRDERDEMRETRTRLIASAQANRQKLRKFEEQIHAKELEVGKWQHERATLSQRLREDYEIELSELEHIPTPEEQQQREEVETEITDLRRKLNNIGSVNLEALAELDDLEARYNSLAAQHEDLSKAKVSLEQIIGRINTDSRRLFSETLETVRGHFQTLFRKLFGGGQADIILEEGEDVLECGIEIVARPPGKEPRSISLLSGGEKTMTCVALLLAIFRSRPSPFCVLDEVDAALDEANIERFTNVVKEFLEWTQFIVVTHSKKTMTVANTLYGVTMQESGISKRVSVRFEDVSEDGHIHHSALAREEESSESTEGDDDTQAA